MLFEHKIDPGASQAAYEVIIDALMTAGMNRAEAVVGLLAVLGTQYADGAIDGDKMAEFIKDASNFMAAYFDTDEEIKN